MNSNMQFDFLVDKESNIITINREFAADRDIVWDAYTQSEYLEQWFAPKPWKAKTKTMDFREGGCWLYAMCGPNGEEHWARADYLKINPKDSYAVRDAFCDSEGNDNPDLPKANWLVMFSDVSDNTLVNMVIKYESLNDLETIIKMGFKEGMTMTLDGLDELLASLKK